MSAESTDWLKWSWVAGCLVAAAFRLAQAEKRRRGQADLRLLVLGLSMTAAADFLMVICGRDLEGLYCFLAGSAASFLAPGGGGRAFRGRGGAHAAVGSGSGPLLFCASDRQSAPCVEKKAGNTFLCLGAIAVLALRSPCGDSEPGAVRRTAKSVWLALSVQPDGALVFLSAVPGIDFFKQL